MRADGDYSHQGTRRGTHLRVLLIEGHSKGCTEGLALVLREYSKGPLVRRDSAGFSGEGLGLCEDRAGRALDVQLPRRGGVPPSTPSTPEYPEYPLVPLPITAVSCGPLRARMRAARSGDSLNTKTTTQAGAIAGARAFGVQVLGGLRAQLLRDHAPEGARARA